MKTQNTVPPSDKLLRALSAAHTFNRLESGLRALPNADLPALKTAPAFADLDKAREIAQSAETLRKQALRALAETLTGGGWNEETVLTALENPLKP